MAIAINVGFMRANPCPPALRPIDQRINIVLLVDGVDTLVEVVIVNLIRVDLVL